MENCSDLWVQRETSPNVLTISYWELSDAELAEIIKHRTVALVAHAVTHPPVSLVVPGVSE
jgi:hypothetical protein